MAETIIILGDWNSTLPAAPQGRENVQFAVDRTGAISKFSASIAVVPTIFLIGIGAAIEVAENVAPVYKVKRVGTIYKFMAKAKTALADDVSFMLVRKRNNINVDILTGALTIDEGSVDWIETTDFANDDLEIDDELQLDVLVGSPKDITLELFWS
jgi:hypothetical protein